MTLGHQNRSLPSAAPFPPPSLRAVITSKEWEACLDAWTTLIELHLRFSSSEFCLISAKDGSLVSFLVSYMSQNPSSVQKSSYGEAANLLYRKSFLLVHRFFLEVDNTASPLLQWTFLAHLSAVYPGSKAVKFLFAGLWKRKSQELETAFLKVRAQLIQSLDVAGQRLNHDPDKLFTSVPPLFRASSDIAQLFLAGSELIDALSASYTTTDSITRRKILHITISGFVSLIHAEQPNLSLVFDHLYSLIGSVEPQQHVLKGKPTLLADLVSRTQLISQIEGLIHGVNAARAKPLLTKLKTFGSSMRSNPEKPMRHKMNKDKQRADEQLVHNELGESFPNDIHVHRMSLVSQVQDLFPDLDAGYVMELLDEHDDDVEKVTAYLLDNPLPTQFHTQPDTSRAIIDIAPRGTPSIMPPRHNIFENDELDNLTVEASRLYMGRKNPDHTADDILNDRSSAPNKAAILSALAAFDSDDDERDDTYDIADVGGTVDSAAAGASDEINASFNDQQEESLFNAYKTSLGVFARDSATKRGQARAALRSATGMTDEAIEGWGLMLGRDSRLLRRLEAKYTLFAGGQRELKSTAWRTGESADEGDEVGGSARGRAGGNRGRVRGGAGRGQGDVSGAGPERDTQISRQRKEANKGSRANHNRRDQRARKMARGGGP